MERIILIVIYICRESEPPLPRVAPLETALVFLGEFSCSQSPRDTDIDDTYYPSTITHHPMVMMVHGRMIPVQLQIKIKVARPTIIAVVFRDDRVTICTNRIESKLKL